MKFLARSNLRDEEALPLPRGFRLTLGAVQPAEYSGLLRAAFPVDLPDWELHPNAIGVPIIRFKDGLLAAACTVVQPFFLHQFAVNPTFQQQGLGTHLLVLTAQLFELPYISVMVDDTTTEDGLRFWNKHAFKELGSC